MTPQEIFDTVVTHLRKQGHKALAPVPDDFGRPNCMYRTPDGDKCAVGCLIHDDEYDPSYEGWSIFHVLDYGSSEHPSLRERLDPHRSLIRALQRVHDDYAVSDWEGGFQNIAENMELIYTPKEEKHG